MEHTPLPAGKLVVGVDGSSHADRALDWAVDQALLEHRALVILHAVDLLGPGQAVWFDTAAVDRTQLTQALESCGRDLLANATARASRLAPELELSGVLSMADPRNALLEAADEADMIVVGSRGRGPVSSLLLGSVSVAVSKHAKCPVVVIRPEEEGASRQGVLVGVEGTGIDHDVVETAFRLVSLRALPLTALHSFFDANHLGRDEHVVPDDEAGLDDLRLLLRDAVRESSQAFPDVDCRLELTRGFTDRRLIERAQQMDVVVVGSRRPADFPRLDVGSLAPAVVEHSQCAVVVVPVVSD